MKHLIWDDLTMVLTMAKGRERGWQPKARKPSKALCGHYPEGNRQQ